jgi:ornithine cyclodeaminase/alanine dehydrogenase-like protein (mu-crystallin family)
MSGQALWITEAEVAALVDISDAIAALERGLSAEAAGGAVNMAKTHLTFGHGDTLHAIGATMVAEGLVGTKTWAHTEGGANPLLILFDAADGQLVAVIEAFALGQLRTAAISGLAARWLSAPDAREMALVGAGKQALAQIAAVAAVRRLTRVRVASRNPENAAAFAKRASAELKLEVAPSASIAAAVRNADIITLVTRATAPFLSSAMVAPGAHINAVGAVVPERAEFEPAMLARCAIVAADTVAGVRALSREFIEFYGTDDRRWSGVQPLSRVIAAGKGRPKGADLTLFKAMGMGISDLSMGIEVLARARANGAGRPLAPTVRARPRLVGGKA